MRLSALLLATSVMLTIVTACAAGPAPRPVDHSGSMLVQVVADKTVMLTNKSVCAGVWVGEHEILTANHCVTTREWCTTDSGLTIKACSKLPKEATAVFYFRTRDEFVDDEYSADSPTPALLIKQNPRSDLALLWTDRSSGSHAQVAAEEIPEGSLAHVIGHPETVPYMHVLVRVRRNAWERVAASDGRRFVRRHTVLGYRAAGGTSGGGAWNERGELVGICLSRSPWKFIHESHFASVQEIRAFLGLRGPMSPRNG